MGNKNANNKDHLTYIQVSPALDYRLIYIFILFP